MTNLHKKPGRIVTILAVLLLGPGRWVYVSGEDDYEWRVWL